MSLNEKVPQGYEKTKVYFVSYMKHNGRHKARFVASRYLTNIPLLSVHSGVVSQRCIQLILFLAKPNKLDS